MDQVAFYGRGEPWRRMSDFLLYLSQYLPLSRLQHSQGLCIVFPIICGTTPANNRKIETSSSQGVMRVMADLVDIYGLECDQAVTAGLMHDAATDLNQEYLLRYIKQP